MAKIIKEELVIPVTENFSADYLSSLDFLLYPYFYFDKNFFLNSENWTDLKNFMGGKGLSLAIMTALGINVPDGFTLSTKYGRELYENGYKELPPELKTKIKDAVKFIKNKPSEEFADSENPLAVAVRSGAPYSMPGAMDTILNVGFSRSTIEAFSRKMGEKEAYECFHIFCFGWTASQLNINKSKLEKKIETLLWGANIQEKKTLNQFKEEINFLERWLVEEYQIEIPQDPTEQLESSVLAIYRSYHSPDAITYRQRMGISEELDATTGVNVVTMVHGHQGENSGSGVVFSHDPKTGEPGLQVQYLQKGAGDIVVSGSGNGFHNELTPELQAELESVVQKLVEFGDNPVDVVCNRGRNIIFCTVS